ncbi:tetratricopeptide repeat protein [Paracidobacterium acidisoli]|uniref:tetratricopeptide repeat protein n=1 Tax=Paracidobacterium acidisoli TaxID=2303751 RepID=UPI003315EF08
MLRILRIRAPQLRAWERQGLISASEEYSFQDLVQLRTLRQLCAMRLSTSSIRAGVRAMRAVSGMDNPLLEAGTMRSGSRVVFRYLGHAMEPIAQQYVFDFDAGERPHQLAQVEPNPHSHVQHENHIATLFLDAVHEEESGRLTEATTLYEEILALQPDHAPAAINLGTILYNQRKFLRAEELYRSATLADPGYALAFFDLGNVLDELQRLPEAIAAYQTAIRLVPGYADAHYNLALACERSNERRRALRHWMAYLRYDPIGPWANHARCQARKILDRERLAIVWRRPRTKSIAS